MDSTATDATGVCTPMSRGTCVCDYVERPWLPGFAILAVAGTSVPAQAAAPKTGANAQAGWILIDNCASRFDCVDAGQQYEREGW
ncbi:hypothetical protein [Actinomadura violacea]|uniref:Uncharacterized protein n=1 Tax=Actinomadura violacea TaxID=2819934 RepID=A0ABS3S8B3_9ACTN|nr:hypothetical protein [Actinomadura violacea]MBO2465245.1 hypothetical protein [Actinomadura violacea]